MGKALKGRGGEEQEDRGRRQIREGRYLQRVEKEGSEDGKG